MTAKPRLLYFNGPWEYLGDRIYSCNVAPLRRVLDEDFEVVSLEGDRNFRTEVEKHRPDMVLFHTGTHAQKEPEVRITETDAHPEIPRAGYILRDPVCPSRISAMNRLRAWRVHQVFSAFRQSDCPIPYFQDSIYVPWWVDHTVFRDYGEKKVFPITVTGSGWLSDSFFYTWRMPVLSRLLLNLPVFHVPVFDNHKRGDAYVGESYARLLNRSQISGACGSINRFLTLKPLEIPASRCCLLAEEIDVLKAIGFVDGVNCIFATEENVVEKVRTILNDPPRLQQITDAGHRLVQENHTFRHRKMFIEWFNLWRHKSPTQRIVQVNPFQPLQLADINATAVQRTFPTENPLVEALHAGYRFVGQQKWPEALERFEWVLKIVPYVAEARLGAGICELQSGRTEPAMAHFIQNLNTQLYNKSEAYPDPLNLAFFAAGLARRRSHDKAIAVLGSTPSLRHPALNALRWVYARAKPELRGQPGFSIAEGDESCSIETVHLLPARTFAQWARTWSACFQ